MIRITETLTIPEQEVRFTASRSGGPGGQNVNKVNTRVTLHFPFWLSDHLTNEQKSRIALRLKTRINKEGVLSLHAQRHRSQAANRTELVGRFSALIRDALVIPKARKRHKITKAAKERRLHDKKRKGYLKQERGPRIILDD